MGKRVPQRLQRRFHRSGWPVFQKVKQWFCASWLGTRMNWLYRFILHCIRLRSVSLALWVMDYEADEFRSRK